MCSSDLQVPVGGVVREMRPVRLRMLFGVEQDGAGRRIPPAVRARHDATLDIGELEITPP